MVRWVVFRGKRAIDELDADDLDQALDQAEVMHGKGVYVRSKVSYELGLEEWKARQRNRRIGFNDGEGDE